MRVRRYILPRTRTSYFSHGNIIKYCGRNKFLTETDKLALKRDGAWHDGDWKGSQSSKWRITPEAIHMMNEALIQNINDMVGEDDVLYHLGDWAFGHKGEYYKTCRYFRDRIICRNVHLIWGNHDRHEIYDLFSSCNDLTEIHVNNQLIVLCHYPLLSWNKAGHQSWMLFGHCHINMNKFVAENLPNSKMLDVGVDGHDYIPWSFQQTKDYMGTKFSGDVRGR